MSGVLDIVYAPFVVLAPFFDEPTPVLMMALGAVSVATAVGIWFVQEWGRVAGIGLCLFGIAYPLAVFTLSILRGSAVLPDVLGPAGASVAWTALLAGLPLWVLLRRWPGR
jgi:hypothetical protein